MGLIVGKHEVVDLFAGAGGLSLGFSSAFGHPFRHKWALDSDTSAADTYQRNFGCACATDDILDLIDGDPSDLPTSADVVIGGPPCQGFSLLNKKRVGDPRRELWRPFLAFVRRLNPPVWVMENVPGLLGSFEDGEIRGHAEEMGYTVVGQKLLAADFGVPQKRIRAFLVGWRGGDPAEFFPPKPTHSRLSNVGEPLTSKSTVGWATVRDAIGDLPPPVGTQVRAEPPPLDLHFTRSPTETSKRRYRAVPDQGMNRFDLQERAPELTPRCWVKKKTGGTDLFGRLWWDRPSLTIRTEFFKPEKGRYLHPEQHRPLTHREAARIQTFPDDFKFSGTKIEIAKQIGNAVPPLLAAAVASSVVKMLDATDGTTETEIIEPTATASGVG